jgi:hypothetical protein
LGGGGGCKGVFSTKFRKNSEQHTENLLLLLEKIEDFQLLGSIHSSTPPPASAASVYSTNINRYCKFFIIYNTHYPKTSPCWKIDTLKYYTKVNNSIYYLLLNRDR